MAWARFAKMHFRHRIVSKITRQSLTAISSSMACRACGRAGQGRPLKKDVLGSFGKITRIFAVIFCICGLSLGFVSQKCTFGIGLFQKSHPVVDWNLFVHRCSTATRACGCGTSARSKSALTLFQMSIAAPLWAPDRLASSCLTSTMHASRFRMEGPSARAACWRAPPSLWASYH